MTLGAGGVLVLVVAAMVAFSLPQAAAQGDDQAGTVTFSETLAVGTELTASLTDPDGSVSVRSWKWERSKRPDTGWELIHDTASSSDTDTFTPRKTETVDDTAYFLRATATYTDGQGQNQNKTASAVTPLPVGVSSRVLMKNTGRSWMTASLGPHSQANQGVVTGDSPAGYLLREVVLYHRNWPEGEPLAVYAKRPGQRGWGSHAFSMALIGSEDDKRRLQAPPGTVLESGLLHYLRTPPFDGSPVFSVTRSADPDAGAASGWRFSGRASGTIHLVSGEVWLRVEISGVELLGPPGPPLSVSGAPGDASVTVAWMAPGSTGHRDVEKYRYRYKETGGVFGEWTDVADSADPGTDEHDERSVTVSGLTPGEYMFEVRAVNSESDPTTGVVGAAAQVMVTVRTSPVFSESDYPGGAVKRSVAENAAPDDLVGLPVTAADADGDEVTYSVSATSEPGGAADLDAFSRDFDLDPASGQIRVSRTADIDYETRRTYVVLYGASDGEDPSDGSEDPVVDAWLTLTVEVTNVDEAGTVSISGIVEVGQTLTASLSDPDVMIDGEAWRWQSSIWRSSGFADIEGADTAEYVVADADVRRYLRATVTYTDAEGPGKSAAGTTRDRAAAAVTNLAPSFDNRATTLQVSEDTAPGSVLARYRATDDGVGVLAYSVAGADRAGFGTGASARFAWDTDPAGPTYGDITLRMGTRLDYETKPSYSVILQVSDGLDNVEATDSTIDDTVALTITVTNVEEPGTLTLPPTPISGAPYRAVLDDTDGVIRVASWSWERSNSPGSGSWETITGAASPTYRPTGADIGYWLRATVTYTDKTAPSTPRTLTARSANPVRTAPSPPQTPPGGGGGGGGGGLGGGGFGGVGVAGAGDDSAATDPPAATTSRFADVDSESVHAAGIEALYAAGITRGCSQEPLRYCPDQPVTRAQMATFLTRALNLQTPEEPAGLTDVDPDSVHAPGIEALYAAGITRGCSQEPLRYCPDQPVTRAQMATFLTRALDLPPAAQPAGFTDVDPDSVHAPGIEALYAAGITRGCSQEPLRYCPDQPVTRAQMATFLARALGL